MLGPAEATLDEVALLVDRIVEVEPDGPRRIGWDDSDGAGLRGIAALPGAQDDPDGAAEAADGEVDPGAPAAA